MRKRIIALLLALILTVGLLPTVALAAEGDLTLDGDSTTTTDTKTSGVDSEGNTDNPVHIVKSVTTDEHGNGTLKLEAYVTDPMTIKTSDVPLDIVLVLDQSGSMGYCVNCGAEFTDDEWSKKKCKYTQYVEVDLAKNLTSSSSSGQLYAFNSWLNSYNPVKYCDGTPHLLDHVAGWYWNNLPHISLNRISSESKLYKKVTTESDKHVHRLDTLTGVLSSFTKSVVDKATGTPNVKHRIAMVGFSSCDYSADYKNTEILTGVNKLSNSNKKERNGNDHYYFPHGNTATNGVQKNTANNKDYKNALVDVSQSAGQTSVVNAINALTACGGTFTDDGLEMAQKIFNANPLTGENAGRKRIVILFTDGAVDKDHKIKAESTATALKSSGVTVYTIGLFEKANQTTNEGDNDFLQKVSSNNGVAPKQGEKSYYLSATNAASLQKVFEQITEEVNKLMLNVGASTVLSDTLSEHFDFAIPANGDLSDKVTFKLVPVDNKDADGNFTWKEADARTLTGGEKPTLNHAADGSKSFTVTNFDYGANKITRVYDQTTGQITGYTGSKLVIEIPIKADTSCTSWDATNDTYPTNSSTNGAKLEYKDEKNNSRSTGVASPEAPVARYSVTYDHGTGSEKPAGVSMPTHTRAYIDGQTIEVMPASTAPDGYTFDGWYTDADCTPNNKVDAANPPAIDKANRTLYGKFTKSVFPVDLSTNIKKQLNLQGGVTALPTPESFEITLQEFTTDGTTKTNVGNAITAKTAAISSGTASFTVDDTNKLELSLSVGTHTFEVTETNNGTSGMTYAYPQIVTVVVTANGDGTASAAVTNGTITNTYKPGAAEFDLTGKFQKRLTSNTATLPTGANSFELKVTGNSTELTGTATVDTLDSSNIGTKSFTFKNAANEAVTKLTFPSADTYAYTVQETNGNVAGMSYDTTEYTLTVVVADNAGALGITSAIVTKPGTSDTPVNVTDLKTRFLTIEHTFTAATLPLDPPLEDEDPESLTAGFKVIKYLTGDTKTETFRAQLLEGTTVKATASAAATTGTPVAFNGFGTLVFTEAKTYNYIIKEIPGSTAGMKYDESFHNGHTMDITVEENTDKQLYVSRVEIDGEEVSLSATTPWLTITNTYTKPTYRIVKNVITDTDVNIPGWSFERPVDGKIVVDADTDTIRLGYVIKITGSADASFTLTEDEGSNFITNNGGSDVSVVIPGKKLSITLSKDYDDNNPILIYTGKEISRDTTTKAFPATVKNVVTEEDNTTHESGETTIEERGALTVDFGDFVRKHLTVTGDKSFNGATFTVNFTDGTFIKNGKENEPEISSIEVYVADAGVNERDLPNLTASVTYGADERDAGYKYFDGADLTIRVEGTYFYLVSEVIPDGATGYDTNKYIIGISVENDGDHLEVAGVGYSKYIENSQENPEITWNEGPTFHNTIDTGKDDYYPIIIPTIINKDTGMLNKTDHFAYVIGYPDGTVHPNGQITRAEVATIFFRLLRDEVRDGAFTTSNTYSDVAYGKWYNNPISTMSALGIITGYPDGTFKPNKPITRAEFAAIAARFDETQSGKSATFSDVIGHWAAKEIGIAYYNDWIKGYPDGTFKPDQNITRAEAMTLINRVLERKPESPADLLTNMNKWTDNLDTSKWYYLDVQEATNSHGYTRKTFNYELWRQMLPDPDWSRYER